MNLKEYICKWRCYKVASTIPYKCCPKCLKKYTTGPTGNTGINGGDTCDSSGISGICGEEL